MKKNRSKSKKPRSPASMPGFDYGVDRKIALMTAPDFNDNLRAANIIACAYGEMRHPDVGAVIPVITLVATKADFLKSAMLQFKGWIDATGPDALNVEILYSGAGYYIGFGPQYQHAMWRTVGVDQIRDPLFYGVTYIKKIDSRHAMVDELARHSTNPVAPIMLTGAHFTGDKPRGTAPSPSEIAPIQGCPELLLLRLPIYKTSSEVPEFSGLRTCVSTLTEAERAELRRRFQEQEIKASGIFARRERRLSSLMPITLHILRTASALQSKLRVLEQQGIERWQLEQAAISQRFWSLANPAQRARFQNPNDLHKALENFMELDNPNLEPIIDDQDTIIKQVLRDARTLLKKIGVRTPDTLAECQAQLMALGYLRQTQGAK
jgi:hypothetical protein